MAEEISNKTLAVIVIAAIVVTLGSTALILRMGSPVITGMATEVAGTAEFNISGIVSIRITDAIINLGAGNVDPGENFAVIYTDGTATETGTWTPADDGFEIMNDGNLIANISINASETAADIIGGAMEQPSIQWKISQSENAIATVCPMAAMETWTEITTAPQANFCSGMQFAEASDEARMDLRVLVPADATPGERILMVTFTAEAAE